MAAIAGSVANGSATTVAGSLAALPPIVDQVPTERDDHSIFAGLWIGLPGLRSLQMLPIFPFEFAWKSTWLLFFGLPHRFSGVHASRFNEDLLTIGNGPIRFGLIIPWRSIYRHHVKQPGDRSL